MSMTAKKLIQKLQKLQPDTKIVIRGYEDGYNDIQKLIERKLTEHPNQKADYYGEYADTEKEDVNNFTIAVELWGENTKKED